jgi:hypothetical protein
METGADTETTRRLVQTQKQYGDWCRHRKNMETGADTETIWRLVQTQKRHGDWCRHRNDTDTGAEIEMTPVKASCGTQELTDSTE